MGTAAEYAQTTSLKIGPAWWNFYHTLDPALWVEPIQLLPKLERVYVQYVAYEDLICLLNAPRIKGIAAYLKTGPRYSITDLREVCHDWLEESKISTLQITCMASDEYSYDAIGMIVARCSKMENFMLGFQGGLDFDKLVDCNAILSALHNVENCLLSFRLLPTTLEFGVSIFPRISNFTKLQVLEIPSYALTAGSDIDHSLWGNLPKSLRKLIISCLSEKQSCDFVRPGGLIDKYLDCRERHQAECNRLRGIVLCGKKVDKSMMQNLRIFNGRRCIEDHLSRGFGIDDMPSIRDLPPFAYSFRTDIHQRCLNMDIKLFYFGEFDPTDLF